MRPAVGVPRLYTDISLCVALPVVNSNYFLQSMGRKSKAKRAGKGNYVLALFLVHVVPQMTLHVYERY